MFMLAVECDFELFLDSRSVACQREGPFRAIYWQFLVVSGPFVAVARKSIFVEQALLNKNSDGTDAKVDS